MTDPTLMVEALMAQIVERVEAGYDWLPVVVAHDADDDVVWALYPDEVAQLHGLLPPGVALFPSVAYLVMSATATMAMAEDADHFPERGDMERALRRGDERVQRCAVVQCVGPWPAVLGVAMRDRDGAWTREPGRHPFGGELADLMAMSMDRSDPDLAAMVPTDELRREWVSVCIGHGAQVVVELAALGLGPTGDARLN